MQALVASLWAAGGLQLAIAAANVLLPGKLRYRENLSRVSPIIRQIFVVHSIYVVFVVLFFAVLCLFFAPELAGGTELGRFLSATMAIFWLMRVLMQLFYYDADLRKQNRLADAAFSLSALFLGSVLAVAALGLAR
jgi:hypothetical protein